MAAILRLSLLLPRRLELVSGSRNLEISPRERHILGHTLAFVPGGVS
jgi:hypothetical protein